MDRVGLTRTNKEELARWAAQLGIETDELASGIVRDALPRIRAKLREALRGEVLAQGNVVSILAGRSVPN